MHCHYSPSFQCICIKLSFDIVLLTPLSAVFGKEGMIPLIVTGMIAGYHSSFEIKMSREIFQQHKSEFKTCDEIRIGPFHFTKDAGSSSDSWTEDIGSRTFCGKSEAKYPFIMGFMVSNPV